MAARLVICCDGTWDTPDEQVHTVDASGSPVRSTNVAKMALAVTPQDEQHRPQKIYYHKGVGTGRFDRLRGGIFGWGLSRNILDAYRFLIERYEPGDEIFLFGFSRGAYTVRSLAGLIRNAGILRPAHRDRLQDAYALYRRRDSASHPAAAESVIFRKMYAHEAAITFIGVWDTVGSLGIPPGIRWLPVSWLRFLNRRWEFHDVQLSHIVENAYQALAIDEHRAPFRPSVWSPSLSQPPNPNQCIEQVWFSGVHRSIGGGDADPGLSDIAFHWLAEKAMACGLALDPDYLSSDLRPNDLGRFQDSYTGIYRLLGLDGGARVIGAPSDTETGKPVIARVSGRPVRDPSQFVHRSTLDREQDSPPPGYHPRNLDAYLAEFGSDLDEVVTPAVPEPPWWKPACGIEEQG